MKHITITTFSTKKGTPKEYHSDHSHLFTITPTQMRNPWRIKELRKLNGLDERVQQCVLGCGGGVKKVDDIWSQIVKRSDSYYYNIPRTSFYISCPNGKHRSVAVAELVAKRLRESGGFEVGVEHLALQPKVKDA